MTKATLATQAEVLTLLAYAKLPYTAEDIPEIVIDMVTLDVETWLARSHISFSAITELDDIRARGFLWGAHMCAILEELARRGQIEQSSGDVSSVKTGDKITQFQRWQPMFFFAKGIATGFYMLLPHMTYQMKAMQLIRSWIFWNFGQDYSGEVAFGTVVANVNNESVYQYPDVMGALDTISLAEELEGYIPQC